MNGKIGKIIAVTGVSASGKSYLMTKLKKRGYVESISHTTRKPREGEINGVDFYFIKKEEVPNINFVEKDIWAKNIYGTSKEELDGKLKTNEFVFVIVSQEGAKNLKKIYGKDNVKKVFVSISRDTMVKRLYKRVEKGEISPSDKTLRLKMASINFEFYGFKDADLVLDGTNPNNIEILLEFLKTNK